MKAIVRKYSGGAYKVCGAVMGAYVIANFIKGNRNMEEPAKWNEDDIELLQEIEKRFKEKNSTVMCRELKGVETGQVLRTCRGCVEDAAEILEEILTAYKIRKENAQEFEKTNKEAVKFCDSMGLEFDKVNENLDEEIKNFGDSRKIFAHYYLDDKAMKISDITESIWGNI